MIWKWKRPAAFLLAAAMIFTMPGVPAFAVETDASAVHTGLCEHHPEHTEGCGYTEGTEGAACEHEHTEDCYTLVEKCVHEHDESCYPVLEESISENTATPSEAEEAQPTACTHECSEESGCITKELSCPHERGEHDDTCGYIPATEGTPCGYICEQCNSQDSGLVPGVSGNAPGECICETHCEQGAVDPDCPVCSAENADLSACKGTEETVCICTDRCSEEMVNLDCPICSAENADLSACLGKEEAVLAVQALIDALPETVTEDNATEIKEQLKAIDAEIEALTDEQAAKLDMTRYNAVCAALAAFALPQADHTHCVCGGNGEVNGHNHSPNTTWTAATSLPTSAGSYYLTQSVTADWTVPTGEVNLCLNGQTINGKITIGSGATLTLTDCIGSGKLQGSGSGSGVSINGGTFNLYGGTITGFVNGVEIGSHTSSIKTGSSFTMYGGTITSNEASSGGGGGVFLIGTTNFNVTAPSFTMHGGTITGNTAGAPDGGGGGVYVGEKCSFTMDGGTITGNTATNGNGGGIYIHMLSKVTISGGEITNNNAPAKNDTSYGHGGGIYSQSGVTVSNVTITGNNSNFEGGGIYGKGTINLTDATVTDNNQYDVYYDGKASETTPKLTVSGSVKAGYYANYDWKLPIRVSGALSKDSVIHVGVRDGIKPAYGSQLAIAEPADGGPLSAENFKADAADCVTSLGDDGKVYLARCAHVMDSTGYTCEKCKTQFDVRVGESAYYQTLAETFLKAWDGSTITLLRDVTLTGSCSASNTITLDLNGKTITSGDKFFNVDEKLTVKDSSEGGGTQTLNVKFSVRSNGTLAVDDSYTGKISRVELQTGGALEAYTGTIQELLLGEGKGTGYSVKLWKDNAHCCTVKTITLAENADQNLTVGGLLETNHAKCELYGEQDGTWSIVDKSTKIVGLTGYTAYKVQFAECVHQCADDTVEKPVCSKCGKALVVKITATASSDGKIKTAWFPADSGIENGDGYVEAIQTLNGWSAEGYTDATLMPLCDVHDGTTGGIGIANVTLTGKLTVDGGEHLINSTTIAAGADVTFKTGQFRHITINGKASFVGGTYLGSVTASSGAEAVFSGGAYQYLYVKDGGTAVVKNSAAFGEDVEVTKGTLTVEGGSFSAAVVVEGDGTMNVNGGSFTGTGKLDRVEYSGGAKGTVSGGSFADLYLYSSGTAWLAGGSFTKLSTASFGVLSSLLADGAAYYDQSGNAISGSGVSELNDVTVKTHTHTVDEQTGICSVCQKQMAASLTAGNETSWYLTLDAAIAAANGADGEKTIKLYQDVPTTAPSYELTRGPVTLDVNGKKASGETITAKGIQLTVTGEGTIWDVTASGSSAVVKNSTVEIKYITAENGGRLELGGGLYAGLTVKNDGSSASLSGGAYKKIEWGRPYVPANEYLADGYGYKTSEGTWDDGTGSVENVTVTPAPIKSTKVYPNSEIDYSGSTFDAKDSTSVTLTVSVTSDESAGLTYIWCRSINDEWRWLTNSYITQGLTEKYTDADSQTLSITELPAGQTFSYKVQIVTDDGYKCFSKPFTVSTCAHDGDKTLQHDETHHWYVCGKCGAELDRAEHSGGTATCTAKAVCSTCQTAYGELGGHTLTKHDAVDATCTAPGNVEYWHCSVCNKNFSDSAGKGELTEVATPALNHTWGEWEKVSETQHQRICQNDGSHKETGYHTPGTAATCKAPANCSICGQSYGEKNPSNHTGGTEVRNQKEATTTTEGYTGDTYCLGCGEKIASGTVIPKKTSGGSGGTSSGGSSSNDGEDSTIIDRPDKDDPSTPTTGQTTPVKPGINGNANIAGSTVQEAINKAVADAKENGNTANGIAVVVPVNVGDTRKDVQIILKADTLDKLVSSNVKQFTINTDHMTDFGFTLDTLKELNRQTSGDIVLKVKKTTVTSVEAKAAVGTRPVYDISLWEMKNGKETKQISLNGKGISIAIPYAPEKNEQTGNLYAVYVYENGKVQWITKSSYDADQKAVIFEAEHFSIYGIGYKNPVPAFTDIQNHWAADNILFVASRGLLSGTSDTTFSPNTGMTRGMFVTALGRLAGINPDSYKTGKFTDVKADAYYAPYVNWAAQTGIVEGVTATTFVPDTNINREQMAVIMANYAKKLGYTVPKTLEAVTFVDNASISSWAKEAVKSMQQAGILAGKTNNRFDPAGTATRAEVATVLRRFVEIVIDPQAANGWQQNDSGQWSYYRNGEPVKGWLSDDQKWYWLDKTTGMMFAGGWKQIDGKWYYFYADGSMAVNTTVDGKTVGADGARK